MISCKGYTSWNAKFNHPSIDGLTNVSQEYPRIVLQIGLLRQQVHPLKDVLQMFCYQTCYNCHVESTEPSYIAQ
jgi:hypothetical protein